MKKKILLLLCLIPIFCIMSAYANDDIKVFNNGAYVEFSNPPVVVNGTVMAPAVDLINAREDWKATYYPQEHTVCGYFKWGSSVSFTAGQTTFCYKDIAGKNNYYEFVQAPYEINGVLYIPVRGYYENIYNYIVEWKEEEKEVFTYLYNNGTPIQVVSDNGAYGITMKTFDVTYVEETFFSGEFEVRYRHSGVRTKGRIGKMYAHWYDKDGKYLKSIALAMREAGFHDEFTYVGSFYVPKEARNIYFSIDKVTPTQDPVVFWRNIW